MERAPSPEAGEPRLPVTDYIELAIQRAEGAVIGHRTARLIAKQLHERMGMEATAMRHLAATGGIVPERLWPEITGEFTHAAETEAEDEERIKDWCVELGRYVSLFVERDPVRGWYLEDLELGPEYDREGFCLDCRAHQQGPHEVDCPRGGGELDWDVVSEERDTPSPTYNELDCCVACGEHISYPHQPGCPFDSAGD